MIIALILMLYALMIAVFDTELGIMFGTIFLLAMMVAMKLIEAMDLDKRIDEWLEKE